jgi:hypothetical protein
MASLCSLPSCSAQDRFGMVPSFGRSCAKTRGSRVGRRAACLTSLLRSQRLWAFRHSPSIIRVCRVVSSSSIVFVLVLTMASLCSLPSCSAQDHFGMVPSFGRGCAKTRGSRVGRRAACLTSLLRSQRLWAFRRSPSVVRVCRVVSSSSS